MSEPDFYLLINGQQAGPYNREQVTTSLKIGQLKGEVMAWHEGLTEWKPLDQIEGIETKPTNRSGIGWKIAGGIGVFLAGVVFVALLLPRHSQPVPAPASAAPVETIEHREQSAVSKAKQIATALLAYRNDHGDLPQVRCSTELFQILLNEKYVSDPSLFYVPMANTRKPTSSQLTAENVGFDLSVPITSKTPDDVPIVYTTGYSMWGDVHQALAMNGVDPLCPGIAYACKDPSQAGFIKAGQDGKVEGLPGTFDHSEIYRQLDTRPPLQLNK